MRKLAFLFAGIVTAAVVTGCSGPEHKLARGFSNTMEIIRWGDMRHSVEQNAVFSSSGPSYAYGAIHGFDQSISRVGIGLYEMVTFPIPSYDPVCTNYLPVNPQYPDSYKPGLVSSATFDTDTYTGFSGGAVAPWLPGSRFFIFDN